MLTFWVALVAALLVLVVWDPANYRKNPRTPLARSIAWIRARLVDDARNFLRWWSVRFNLAGLALLSWVQFDPIGVLAVWNMAPAGVKAVLPPSFVLYVGFALSGLSILARVVKQPAKGSADAK